MFHWLTRSFWPRLRRTLECWSSDDISVFAAATSYYTALSFFPLLLVAIAAFGFVLQFSESARNAREELLELIARDTSVDLANQIREILGQVEFGASFSGSIGMLVLSVNLLGILYQLQMGFDRIWAVTAPNGGGFLTSLWHNLQGRLKAFLLLAGLGLLLLASFVSGIVLEALYRFANDVQQVRIFSGYTEILIVVVANAPIFAAIYKVQPRDVIRWSDVWLGSFLAAATWEVGRQLLSMFVVSKRYNAYGVVGSFIALMIWVYYACNVLFLGAEFVRATQLERKEREKTA
ncbi:MAG: YihY/virulence factor BrkB family protein [Planctomycetota bacterium]